ncbi:MAG: alpha-ketoglutarate-dependent dioxygenase AlkB [Flavobacterium sp.]|nr:MAG: alpha-ketoglutarate-dependent dioxygenase AlkB [Flavobacterium sp.]
MNLFDDTAIFSSGSQGKQALNLPDADILLWDSFFSKEESDHYYNVLLAQTPWKKYEMEIYDKSVTAPRMIAWYQDENAEIDPGGNAWTPELLEIRKRVEAELGISFNSVLLNLYRDGNDGVAWHSDREHKIGKNPTIASVTFGETRMFRLRHKSRKDLPQVEIPLHHGTLLLMSGTTNTFWQHQIPKTKKSVLPRINLTFRRVVNT